MGVKIAPRETENNAYAKLWSDKQRALWYVMVFFVVVSCSTLLRLANANFLNQNPHNLKKIVTRSHVACTCLHAFSPH